MKRARFGFSSEHGFQHCSLFFVLCVLSLSNAGCGKTDTQEYEPYSNLSLAQLDSAIANSEARVDDGAHEQNLLDSLGEAYLRRMRLDLYAPYSVSVALEMYEDWKPKNAAHLLIIQKAERILTQAIDQNPNDLSAKRTLVEVLLAKLRAYHFASYNRGLMSSPSCYEILNEAYQLGQNTLRLSKDSVLLWRPMAELYRQADSYYYYDRATYAESAHAFISAKLSKDRSDPLALTYSDFDYRDRGSIARMLLHANLAHPFMWTILYDSKYFYQPAGGVTTWLERLSYIPDVVKFSYSQGFRLIKTSLSHEEKSLITIMVSRAHRDYPDNEYVFEMLIRDDIANERMDEVLEKFSMLDNVHQAIILRMCVDDCYSEPGAPQNSVFITLVNRFFQLVQEKYQKHPIVDYLRAYRNYFSVTKNRGDDYPISELSSSLQYLDSCLQTDENFLPAYDLLFRIMSVSKYDSSKIPIIRNLNSPEEILRKIITITKQKGGMNLDIAYYDLLRSYQKQGKYDSMFDAANQYGESEGISDVSRIDGLKWYFLYRDTIKPDRLKYKGLTKVELFRRFLQNNQRMNQQALAYGWDLLGTYSFEQKDYSSAEKYFHKSFELAPLGILHHINRLLAAGEYQKIIDAFKNYDRSWWPYIRPDDEIFAWAYYKLGRKALADSILNEIAKVAPKSPRMQIVRAAIAYDLGNTSQASEFIKQAKAETGDVDAKFNELIKRKH